MNSSHRREIFSILILLFSAYFLAKGVIGIDLGSSFLSSTVICESFSIVLLSTLSKLLDFSEDTNSSISLLLYSLVSEIKATS